MDGGSGSGVTGMTESMKERAKEALAGRTGETDDEDDQVFIISRQIAIQYYCFLLPTACANARNMGRQLILLECTRNYTRTTSNYQQLRENYLSSSASMKSYLSSGVSMRCTQLWQILLRSTENQPFLSAATEGGLVSQNTGFMYPMQSTWASFFLLMYVRQSGSESLSTA